MKRVSLKNLVFFLIILCVLVTIMITYDRNNYKDDIEQVVRLNHPVLGFSGEEEDIYIENLAGPVKIDTLISSVQDGSCKDIATKDSCTYLACPCAHRLPPEIETGRTGLRFSHVDPDLLTVVAESYLNMVRYVVLNSFYEEKEYVQMGKINNPEFQMTMLGKLRLDNIQRLLEDAIVRNVPGDFIEAGVWKGGSCAFAAATLKAYGKWDRKVFCADSFKGIPEPTKEGNNGRPITNQDATGFKIASLNDNSKESVAKNFEKLGLTATFIEGYFKPALYDADAAGMFKDGFMAVRLDGDTYQSTWTAIEILYPRLNKGGYLIIDDYTDWVGCREAIQDYRKKFNITEPILPVAHPDGLEVRGAWWRKE